jgi:ABC-type polysaccharide/polyol phosphate transport system ATPase subunit
MTATAAIAVENLGKRFKIYEKPWHRACEWLDGKMRHTGVWALRNISFEVPAGQCLGIIGANGSGKSTLLKILTGVMVPTTGTARTAGPTLALLELGTGFNPELTGRQNVFASASLLGFPPGYAAARLDDIAAFADIGDYFDRPVRLYSSGMFVRLAFSLFLFLEPKVFIVDEALSVGDHAFQQKCTREIHRLKASGTTLILVSHDMAAVQELCDRVILLRNGNLVRAGTPGEVVACYYAEANLGTRQPRPAAADGSAGSLPPVAGAPSGTIRAEIDDILRDSILHSDPVAGVGRLRILGVRVVDDNGRVTGLVRVFDHVTVQVVIEALATVTEPNFGVGLEDRFGRTVFECGCRNHRQALAPVSAGTVFVMSARLRLSLSPGDYALLVAVGDSAGHPANTGTVHDRRMGLGPITVYWNEPWLPFYGIAALEARFNEHGRYTPDDPDRASPLAPPPAMT